MSSDLFALSEADQVSYLLAVARTHMLWDLDFCNMKTQKQAIKDGKPVQIN